jgi:hypothetical protein
LLQAKTRKDFGLLLVLISLLLACLLLPLMASLISVVWEWLHNDVLKFGLELVPQGS